MLNHAALFFSILFVSATLIGAVPARHRALFLLAASLSFYVSTEPVWWPLVFVFAVAYFGARHWSAVPILLLPLVLLKYVPYLYTGAAPQISLGLSFFTLFAIGYVAECRRGTLAPEKNPVKLAAAIAFFPLLTSGPIERAPRLLPQFDELRAPSYARLRAGLLLIGLGIFKKLVIADNLAPYVSEIFGRPGDYSGAAYYAAALMGRYQIFADLSAYTDIARGAAVIFGISIMENFARPFAAAGISDFWRRWHISLSSWMRDYVFMPLIASPFGRFGIYPSIVVTFMILGLWHGPAGNFIVFGMLQGLMISAQDLMRGKKSKLPGWASVPLTFLVPVGLPTVLFFTGLPAAGRIYSAIFTARAGAWPDLAEPRLFLVFGAILVFECAQRFAGDWDRVPRPLRWCTYAAGAAAILLFGKFAASPDFIYRHF